MSKLTTTVKQGKRKMLTIPIICGGVRIGAMKMAASTWAAASAIAERRGETMDEMINRLIRQKMAEARG